MYRQRFFDRRRSAENFYKTAIQEVKEKGYWTTADGRQIEDTVEHLQDMLQRTLRTCV